jgi:plasmid stabilization system protein ParE
MASVVFTAAADADAAFIFDDLYTKAGKPTVVKYRAAFKTLYEHLADFPDSGAPRPKVGSKIRIGIVSPLHRDLQAHGGRGCGEGASYRSRQPQDHRQAASRRLKRSMIYGYARVALPVGRKPKMTAHQKREAVKRRDVDAEMLRSIARSYNVSAATISRLARARPAFGAALEFGVLGNNFFDCCDGLDRVLH